jgi:hypothetical protein
MIEPMKYIDALTDDAYWDREECAPHTALYHTVMLAVRTVARGQKGSRRLRAGKQDKFDR